MEKEERKRSIFGGGELRVGFAHALVALVFLADFFDQSAGDEVLQFFVGAQAEHFFAAGNGIANFQFFKGALEEVVEGKNFVLHEDADEFIGNMIRKAS